MRASDKQRHVGGARAIDKQRARRGSALEAGGGPTIGDGLELVGGRPSASVDGPLFINGRKKIDLGVDESTGLVITTGSRPQIKANLGSSLKVIRGRIESRPDASDVEGLGSAALLDVATSGDAGATEVVIGDDTRLVDDREPLAHTHDWADVTSPPDTLAGYGITDGASDTELATAAADAASALAAHEADTTNVHGIVDTAALALIGHAHAMADITSGSLSATQHGAQTNGTLHAVALFNRSGFMSFDDKNAHDQMFDTDVPFLLAHEAATTGVHGIADTANISLVGHTHAAADVTSGQFAMARLASGTPDGTKFIRDDGTLQAVTAALPDLVLTRLSTNGDKTVTAGYGAYVPGAYEIGAGNVLEIGALAVLEVG